MKHAVVALVFVLAACGGGGDANPPAAVAVPATPAAASATPAVGGGTVVAGRAVQLPPDAYGPVTMGSATFASADAAQTVPLPNAAVIVGPVPVTGATPPAALPPGDVLVMTGAAGTFSAALAVAPAAPASTEPFVVPPDDVLGIVPPAAGYYIEVFGPGTDGKSAGAPLPLHRFVAAATSLVVRVTAASAAEAAALAAVNNDRAAAGAGALVFDESAEEAARLHANDESANGYTCHYDARGVGPSSRYLAAGGTGLTGEGLALAAGAPPLAFANTEAGFIAEGTSNPPGGHYRNLVDPAHAWAGLAAVPDAFAPEFANVDYELVTPDAIDAAVGAAGYPLSAACPNGTAINGS